MAAPWAVARGEWHQPTWAQQQQQQQQQQRVAAVRMPSTSNPMEALKIHDNILGESIAHINTHTTQISSINETLKKIGVNENSLHERLTDIEKLLNTLIMEAKLNKGHVEDEEQDIESKAVSESNLADKSKVARESNLSDKSKAVSESNLSDESKVVSESNLSDESKVASESNLPDGTKVSEKKQTPQSGRFRNPKKGKNNVSMKIEEA